MLDDTTLAAEKEYTINFSEQRKEFCLSWNFKGFKSYIFVNDVEIYRFKAKYSEINATFLIDNMKNTGLYGYDYNFPMDYESVDVAGILHILKCLMKNMIKNNV